jgi:alkylated DNA repair dioxygenase AlkB
LRETFIFRDGPAELILIEDFAPHSLFSTLESAILWQQNKIRVFGREHDEPRLTAWFGPAYSYSGIRWSEAPIPDVLTEWQTKASELAGLELNSALLNYYRDHRDSIGRHADNEPEMDTRVIASLSLGAARMFRWAKRGQKGSHGIPLPSGSLLLMRHFQEDFVHFIPKTTRPSGGRINVTFRRIRS